MPLHCRPSSCASKFIIVMSSYYSYRITICFNMSNWKPRKKWKPARRIMTLAVFHSLLTSAANDRNKRCTRVSSWRKLSEWSDGRIGKMISAAVSTQRNDARPGRRQRGSVSKWRWARRICFIWKSSLAVVSCALSGDKWTSYSFFLSGAEKIIAAKSAAGNLAAVTKLYFVSRGGVREIARLASVLIVNEAYGNVGYCGIVSSAWPGF